MIQFETPNTGKTCAMPWASAQPATTYATATLYTLRRFSSPKKVFGFTLGFCATRHLQAMYIVGQPRRLSGQAERLPYNVGSWLPDYFFGPICSVPDKSCWKSGRLRMGSQTGSILKRAMEATWRAGVESKCRSLFAASSEAPAGA